MARFCLYRHFWDSRLINEENRWFWAICDKRSAFEGKMVIQQEKQHSTVQFYGLTAEPNRRFLPETSGAKRRPHFNRRTKPSIHSREDTSHSAPWPPFETSDQEPRHHLGIPTLTFVIPYKYHSFLNFKNYHTSTILETPNHSLTFHKSKPLP